MWYGEYRGAKVLAFEYQYTTKVRREALTYVYTVVCLATRAPRPYLQVSHEHLGYATTGLVGVRGLRLENDEFDRDFQVFAGDERFARDVLHPRMRGWLLTDQRARTTPFRFEGNTLLCWRHGQLEPETVLEMANFLSEILQRVPPYVWSSPLPVTR